MFPDLFDEYMASMTYRNPEVRWATIEDDVQRRDLTVNALFYDISTQEIVDLVGGIDDIKNGIIRAVGNPAERFEEDSLRTLRAIRFAARMGSELDPDTSQGVTSAAAHELTGTTPERISEEFIKGLSSAQDPQQYVDLALTHGLMKHIFPGLKITNNLEHAPLASQIAALTVGNDPTQVMNTMKRMRFGGSVRDKAVLLLSIATVSPDDAVNLKKEAKRVKLTDDEIKAFTDMSGVPSRTTAGAFMRFVREPSATSARELMDQGLQGAEIGKAMRAADTQRFMSFMSESRSRTLRALLS